MKYEFTFLVQEEKDASEIQKLLESLGGKITEERKWGKRLLAYSIKKQTNAYYITWQFDLERKHLAEFKKKLNFNEKLMRYLLLVI